MATEAGGDWLDSVDENREALEKWAESELPLSDEIEQVLADADRERGE